MEYGRTNVKRNPEDIIEEERGRQDFNRMVANAEARVNTPYADQPYSETSGRRAGGLNPGDRQTIDMMGNLTNAEAQMVISESAKGRMRNRAMTGDPNDPGDPYYGMTANEWYGLGMYEREGYRSGKRQAAEERLKKGMATLDDAMMLGLKRSRYGDFGKKNIQEANAMLDRMGRPVGTDTRTRQVPATAEDWLAQINQGYASEAQREVDVQAERERAQQEAMMAAFEAGILRPRIDSNGNVIGFEEVASDEKFISTQRGVFSTRDRNIIEGTEPQAQADFSDRRKFQQDRNKTFNDATGEPIYTADNYYRTTYDEQGKLREDADVVPVIEQHLDYLNEFASRIGMQEEPFKRAGQASAPSAGDESAPVVMSLAEFIEDFKQDSGKEPTPEQIAAAQGRFWR